MGRGFVLKTGLVFRVTAILFFSFKQETQMSNTLFKIRNLKELTLYCFSIQVELTTYSDLQLLGLQSDPECYRTTISGINQILLFFVCNMG